MILILYSLILGYVGLNIGCIFGPEIFMYLFGLVGALSPGLFVLESIYKEMKNKSN